MSVTSACSDFRDASPTTPLSPGSSGGAIVVLSPLPSKTDFRNEYIVVFNDSVSDVTSRVARIQSAHHAPVHFVYQHALKGFSGQFSEGAIALVRKLPEVRYVELVQLYAPSGPGSEFTGFPNLDLIDQAGLALNNTYSWDQDGSGVHVYVIDDGINVALPEFQGRAQMVEDVTNNAGGFGADCINHGTPVASLIGASNVGVAKGVWIRGVRVIGCDGFAGTNQVIAGLDWVTAHAIRPAVANMSLGGPFSSAINGAVSRAEASGIRVVVAAGNNTANACTRSPASAWTTFTVGNAQYAGGTLSRFADSNFGNCVNRWAVGEGSWAKYRNGVTATFSGTSGASPQVAGWVAIYLSAGGRNEATAIQQYQAGVAQTPVTGTLIPSALLLYTRLGFHARIDKDIQVPAGESGVFTSTTWFGTPPFTYQWYQNGAPRCATASCTIASQGSPGYSDNIDLTVTDAIGQQRMDRVFLTATCQDGGFSC